MWRAECVCCDPVQEACLRVITGAWDEQCDNMALLLSPSTKILPVCYGEAIGSVSTPTLPIL